MPEIDKEAEKQFIKELLKELFREGVFKEAFKEALGDVVQDIIDYCGRWTLKCLCGAALLGVIWLALIGSGWSKK